MWVCFSPPAESPAFQLYITISKQTDRRSVRHPPGWDISSSVCSWGMNSERIPPQGRCTWTQKCFRTAVYSIHSSCDCLLNCWLWSLVLSSTVCIRFRHETADNSSCWRPRSWNQYLHCLTLILSFWTSGRVENRAQVEGQLTHPWDVQPPSPFHCFWFCSVHYWDPIP